MLAAPLAALAATVGFSRVYSGVHYPGDVVAGFALGTGVGLANRSLFPRRADTPTSTRTFQLPERPDGRGVVAVVNPEAGGGEGERIAKLVEDELPAAEIWRFEEGEDLAAALRKAAASAEVLAVAGGDGSINAAAAVALEFDLPLLPLCGGTLNHFAGDLGLAGPDASIEAVRAGCATRVDVGVVESETGYREIFLNTMSFGSYPSFVQRRERWENRVGKPIASVYAIWHVLRREMPVCAAVDGKRRQLALIFVGVGAYEPAGFLPRRRPRLDTGVLDIRLLDSGLHHAGRRLLVAAVAGVLGREGVYRTARQERVAIKRDNADPIARDGEIGDAPADLTVSVLPRALVVYAPVAAAPEASSPTNDAQSRA